MASEVVRDGCFAVNKPKGVSSAQVVRECQEIFTKSDFFKPLISGQIAKVDQNPNDKKFQNRRRKKSANMKIGHGGTLDPLATGVLIMGLGSATKSLNQFLHCVKAYETTMVFGASTDTYDRVGRVLTRRPYEHITREKVEEKLRGMVGKQMQVPPLFSALKMDGKPLYEYAREGKPIPRDIAGREVEIKEIELLDWYEPGTHNHRWPTVDAGPAERNLAEQVWRLKKQQEESGKLTPEEKEEEDQAIAAHETFKRKFEERQDRLVSDSPSKRRSHGGSSHVMSGALGEPEETNEEQQNGDGNQGEGGKSNRKKRMERSMNKQWKDSEHKNKNLTIPDEETDTPPPWEGKGPPACRIRIQASSGFYVRSFCHDLGQMMDSVALMSELIRVRQSDFVVGEPNCLEMDDIRGDEKYWAPKMANALARWNGEPAFESEHAPSNEEPGTTAKSTTDARPPSRTESPTGKKQAQYHQVSPQKRKTPPPRGSSSSPPAVKVRRESSASEKSWNGIAD